jgi:hypothetical protein
MKAAICSRVTLSDEQNSVLSGGLQPRVTSFSASQAMSSWSSLLSGTSMNTSAAMAPSGIASTIVTTRTATRHLLSRVIAPASLSRRAVAPLWVGSGGRTSLRRRAAPEAEGTNSPR